MAENKNPVKICDTTLRDGHQSLLATRMRIEDMEVLAEGIDNIGFWSVETWGGATFDVCHRFLNEDPWERVRRLKKLMPKTPFQMLLRGQNLVGYRNYADDVVKAFVHKSAEVGIDVFRVFDAVNDERNMEVPFEAIKETGKHIQGSICYSLTERKMGGDVFNLDYYIQKAKILEQMGAHSICIKDMAGLIAPYDAYHLVSALKKNVKVPIHLHTHYTSGMASMSYLKAIEAGVDIIDCALAPFALRTSQPAVEPIVVTLEGTDRDTGLDLPKLVELGRKLEGIAPKYRDFRNETKMAVIDTSVLLHQIPGGMTSNLVSQLRQMDALDRLDEVYAELPRTRKELGNAPLVTPTSQIIGVQAVMNVIVGRYKLVSNQVKDYVYGLYGKTPTPIDPEVAKQVLKGYSRGTEPITCRPGDVLECELDDSRKECCDVVQNDEDEILCAIYPITGKQFVASKYGKGEPPKETEKAKTLEDIKAEDERMSKAKKGN